MNGIHFDYYLYDSIDSAVVMVNMNKKNRDCVNAAVAGSVVARVFSLNVQRKPHNI